MLHHTMIADVPVRVDHGVYWEIETGNQVCGNYLHTGMTIKDIGTKYWSWHVIMRAGRDQNRWLPI